MVDQKAVIDVQQELEETLGRFENEFVKDKPIEELLAQYDDIFITKNKIDRLTVSLQETIQKGDEKEKKELEDFLTKIQESLNKVETFYAQYKQLKRANTFLEYFQKDVNQVQVTADEMIREASKSQSSIEYAQALVKVQRSVDKLKGRKEGVLQNIVDLMSLKDAGWPVDTLLSQLPGEEKFESRIQIMQGKVDAKRAQFLQQENILLTSQEVIRQEVEMLLSRLDASLIRLNTLIISMEEMSSTQLSQKISGLLEGLNKFDNVLLESRNRIKNYEEMVKFYAKKDEKWRPLLETLNTQVEEIQKVEEKLSSQRTKAEKFVFDLKTHKEEEQELIKVISNPSPENLKSFLEPGGSKQYYLLSHPEELTKFREFLLSSDLDTLLIAAKHNPVWLDIILNSNNMRDQLSRDVHRRQLFVGMGKEAEKQTAEALTSKTAELFLALRINGDPDKPSTIESELFQPHPEKLPNVKDLTNYFNQITGIVRHEMVSQQSIAVSAKVFEKWVRIADECFKLGNLYSVQAILGAFGDASIHRIHKEENFVSPETRQIFERLQELMGEKDNFKKVRTYLEQNPDTIPYVGLFQTDIEFIRRNPDYVSSYFFQEKVGVPLLRAHQSVMKRKKINLSSSQKAILFYIENSGDQLKREEEENKDYELSLKLRPRGKGELTEADLYPHKIFHQLPKTEAADLNGEIKSEVLREIIKNKDIPLNSFTRQQFESVNQFLNKLNTERISQETVQSSVRNILGVNIDDNDAAKIKQAVFHDLIENEKLAEVLRKVKLKSESSGKIGGRGTAELIQELNGQVAAGERERVWEILKDLGVNIQDEKVFLGVTTILSEHLYNMIENEKVREIVEIKVGEGITKLDVQQLNEKLRLSDTDVKEFLKSRFNIEYRPLPPLPAAQPQLSDTQKLVNLVKIRKLSYLEGFKLLVGYYFPKDTNHQQQSKIEEIDQEMQKIRRQEVSYRTIKEARADFDTFIVNLFERTSRYTGLRPEDVTKHLLDAERYAVWEKRRETLRTPVVLEENLTVTQIDRPVIALTDAIRQEYVNIFKEERKPLWFTSLSSWKQRYLKSKFEKFRNFDLKQEPEETKSNLDRMIGTIPSSLRGVPGLANYGKHEFLIGEETSDSSCRFRSAIPVPIDVKDKKESIRLTRLNIRQLLESEDSPLSQAVKNIVTRNPNIQPGNLISMPILLQSLISPIFFNPKEYKAMPGMDDAIKELESELGKTVSVKVGEDTYPVELRFISPNYSLNWANRPLSLSRDLRKKNEKSANALLESVQTFLKMVGVTSSLEFLNPPVKDIDVETMRRELKNISESRNDLKHVLDAVGDYVSLCHPSTEEKMFERGAHKELFVASLEELIAGQIGMALIFCKSGKDRTGIKEGNTDSLLAYYNQYGEFPQFEDYEKRPSHRRNLVNIFTKLFNSEHQQKWAESNAPGSRGIKSLKSWVKLGRRLKIIEMLPSDTLEAIFPQDEKMNQNAFLAGLNKPDYEKSKERLKVSWWKKTKEWISDILKGKEIKSTQLSIQEGLGLQTPPVISQEEEKGLEEELKELEGVIPEGRSPHLAPPSKPLPPLPGSVIRGPMRRDMLKDPREWADILNIRDKQEQLLFDSFEELESGDGIKIMTLDDIPIVYSTDKAEYIVTTPTLKNAEDTQIFYKIAMLEATVGNNTTLDISALSDNLQEIAAKQIRSVELEKGKKMDVTEYRAEEGIAPGLH